MRPLPLAIAALARKGVDLGRYAQPSSQMPCLASPGFVGARWHDAAMRYSVNVPDFGEFAAPEVFADAARSQLWRNPPGGRRHG